MNVSSYKLSSTESFVLKHGLKFCVPPRRINRIQTFAEFESLAAQLEHQKPTSKENKQQLYAKLYDWSHGYCGTPVDKSDFHMNKECADTARSLRNNNSIIISRPDKGGGIVILDRSDYINRMMTILSDNTKFVKRGAVDKYDRTEGLVRKIRKELTRLLEAKTITEEVHNFIHPTGSQTPRLYGLPKTHKEDIPLRPVLCMVDAPQYKLSKWLISVLEPVLLKYSEYTVKDSFQFVEKLHNVKHNLDRSFMCSYDVKSLFTNVPVLETLDICLNELYHSELPAPPIKESELRRLLLLATTDVEFNFDDTIYRQVDGVAMGSPLGPVLANIFMGFYECKLLRNASSTKPNAYFRYVDDTFCFFGCKEDANLFLLELSKLHPKLGFTCEEETNNTLPFLDVLVERSTSGFLTSVYRKKTFTGDYIAWKSFCPVKRKTNVIACLVNRAIKLCSDVKLSDELDRIREIFLNLGYPDRIIERTVERVVSNISRAKIDDSEEERKSPVYLRLPYLGPTSNRFAQAIRRAVEDCYRSTQLRVVFKTRTCIAENTKGRSPTNQQNNVIYKYVCHCDSVYVGKTTRQLRQRVKDHVPRTFLNRTGDPQLKTAVGQHLGKNAVCRDKYDDGRFGILTKGRNQFHLDVLEALFIQTLKPNLCLQKERVYNTILFKMLK